MLELLKNIIWNAGQHESMPEKIEPKKNVLKFYFFVYYLVLVMGIIRGYF